MTTIGKLVAAFALTSFLCSGVASQPQPYSAIISVDSVSARPGESFGVGIWLTNNTIALAGMVIPLRFTDSRLVYDSVSYTGSIMTSGFRGITYADVINRFVQVSYLPLSINDTLPILASN